MKKEDSYEQESEISYGIFTHESSLLDFLLFLYIWY